MNMKNGLSRTKKSNAISLFIIKKERNSKKIFIDLSFEAIESF